MTSRLRIVIGENKDWFRIFFLQYGSAGGDGDGDSVCEEGYVQSSTDDDDDDDDPDHQPLMVVELDDGTVSDYDYA